MQSRHQNQIRVHLTFHSMDDPSRLAWAMTQIVTSTNECQRTQTVSCCHCASVWPVSKVMTIRYVLCLSFRKLESASNARCTKAIVDQMIFNSGRPIDGVFVYSKRFGGSQSARQTNGRRGDSNSLVTYESMNLMGTACLSLKNLEFWILFEICESQRRNGPQELPIRP